MTFNYRNLSYNKSGTIDCEIEHPKYGWIPFTANPNDPEEHGRKLYEEIKDNKDILPYVPPTLEEIALEVRSKRNRLLSQSDWSQLPDVPQNIKDLWASYRQELRDISDQEGFPYDVVWPDLPQ